MPGPSTFLDLLVAQIWRRIDTRALLVTAFCIVVWRLALQIPVLDLSSGFLLFRIQGLTASAGFIPAIGSPSIPFESYSIGRLGIGPYVAALIMTNLAALVSRRIAGLLRAPIQREQLLRWTRGLALLLALAQAYMWTGLMETDGVLPEGMGWPARLFVCLELAGGTALLILLADLMDDAGLGFGNGAYIFYALGPIGDEVHRLADYVPTIQAGQPVFRPFAVWVALSLGATVVAVAALLAVRRLRGTTRKDSKRNPDLDLPFLAGGVVRPTQIAIVLLSVPALITNYYVATYSGFSSFIFDWSAYGPDIWLTAAYLLSFALLLVLLAMFVVARDGVIAGAPPHARAHLKRLGALSGLLLVALLIAVPIADHYLGRANFVPSLPLSGVDLVIAVTFILITVRMIEGRGEHVARWHPLLP